MIISMATIWRIPRLSESWERGRAVYDIKLDVPISYIHPDLLLSSVRKGFSEQKFGEGAEREELIGKFYDIHLRRYENFMTKRRATHTIFSSEAMMEFAKTGVQSDHFFAMAPYEKQERVQILAHLRDPALSESVFQSLLFQTGIPSAENGNLPI